jgi:hypothetical protein
MARVGPLQSPGLAISHAPGIEHAFEGREHAFDFVTGNALRSQKRSEVLAASDRAGNDFRIGGKLDAGACHHR